MKVGTKSLLFGAHQVIIHPICVAIAWIKLYGFPFSIPIWTAFIVHDWGYWGKPDMDGDEGETHPELGANIMHKLFDKKSRMVDFNNRWCATAPTFKWYEFTLYHSRFYAEKKEHRISKLCVADKYAFCILPKRIYIMLASWSGEIYEYMYNGRSTLYFHSKSAWYDYIYKYMIDWVKEHKDNLNDT